MRISSRSVYQSQFSFQRPIVIQMQLSVGHTVARVATSFNSFTSFLQKNKSEGKGVYITHLCINSMTIVSILNHVHVHFL